MLADAGTDPCLVVHRSAFDTYPMLAGVANGVINLRTRSFVAAEPSQRISRQLGCAFEPEAKCPRFIEFLERVQPDPKVREFLQRAVGYTLTGNVDEEKWFFAYGMGANGKSVFANILDRLMGDYSVTTNANFLARSKLGNSERDRALARLPGARLVLANETAQGSVWDDQFCKEMASREKIAARKPYQESFDFMPTHKLWVRGNYAPGALDSGDGFWRRLLPISFSVQIPEHERVHDLDRLITASELLGVLNWALDGRLAWQKGGLRVPDSVKAKAAQYRAETDLLGGWLAECCVRDPAAKTTYARAYDSYRAYCAEEGVSCPSKKQFSAMLVTKGVKKGRKGNDKAFLGISLKSSADQAFQD